MYFFAGTAVVCLEYLDFPVTIYLPVTQAEKRGEKNA